MAKSVNIEQVVTGGILVAIGLTVPGMGGLAVSGGGLILQGLNPQEEEEILSSESIDARTVSFRSSKPPRQILYGETLVSGPIIYTTTYGVKNEWLLQIMMIATHEVENIGALYLDGKLAIDGDGTIQPDYAGFVSYIKHPVGAIVDLDVQSVTRPNGLGAIRV